MLAGPDPLVVLYVPSGHTQDKPMNSKGSEKLKTSSGNQLCLLLVIPFCSVCPCFSLWVLSLQVHSPETYNERLAAWSFSIVIACPSEKVTILYLQNFETTHILSVPCWLHYLLSSSRLILLLQSAAPCVCQLCFPFSNLGLPRLWKQFIDGSRASRRCFTSPCQWCC